MTVDHINRCEEIIKKLFKEVQWLNAFAEKYEDIIECEKQISYSDLSEKTGQAPLHC